MARIGAAGKARLGEAWRGAAWQAGLGEAWTGMAGNGVAGKQQEQSMKRLTDPTFVYTDAAESSKPGYLARKFAAIRREQERAKQKAAEPAPKVTAITRSKTK